jgi:hypothetical protein
MNNLAGTLWSQGDLTGARKIQEQVLEARRRVLGEDHPDTLSSLNNLASTLKAQGDLAGARKIEEQVLAARRRVLGEDHPDTIASAWNLFTTLYGQKDQAAAQAVFSQHLRPVLDRSPDELSADLKQIRSQLLAVASNDSFARGPMTISQETLAVGATQDVSVDPRQRFVPTGLVVAPGERYAFAAEGLWRDLNKTCGPEGWGGGWMNRFARLPRQSLFLLCGAVGRADDLAFPIGPTLADWTVPDEAADMKDRQLTLFANDVWFMYWNNHALDATQGGPLRVRITRLE